jgi:hypothetical protein
MNDLVDSEDDHAKPSFGRRMGEAWLHHARISRRGEDGIDRSLRLRRWPARVFAVGLVALAVAIGIKLYPHQIIVPKHPSLLDQIFQSQAVVLLIRVVSVFCGGFVIASLLARIWGQQWLTKAGPFEVSVVADATAALDATQRKLKRAGADIGKLNGLLTESNSRLTAQAEVIQSLQGDLATVSAEREDARASVKALRQQVTDITALMNETMAALKAVQDGADDT